MQIVAQSSSLRGTRKPEWKSQSLRRHWGRPGTRPSGYSERSHGTRGGPRGHSECSDGTRASPSSHFQRSGGTGAHPSSNFKKQSNHRNVQIRFRFPTKRTVNFLGLARAQLFVEAFVDGSGRRIFKIVSTLPIRQVAEQNARVEKRSEELARIHQERAAAYQKVVIYATQWGPMRSNGAQWVIVQLAGPRFSRMMVSGGP